MKSAINRLEVAEEVLMHNMMDELFDREYDSEKHEQKVKRKNVTWDSANKNVIGYVIHYPREYNSLNSTANDCFLSDTFPVLQDIG